MDFIRIVLTTVCLCSRQIADADCGLNGAHFRMLKCGVFKFSGHKGGEEMARLERRCRSALYWYDKKSVKYESSRKLQ